MPTDPHLLLTTYYVPQAWYTPPDADGSRFVTAMTVRWLTTFAFASQGEHDWIPPTHRPYTAHTPPTHRPHTAHTPPTYRPHTAQTLSTARLPTARYRRSSIFPLPPTGAHNPINNLPINYPPTTTVGPNQLHYPPTPAHNPPTLSLLCRCALYVCRFRCAARHSWVRISKAQYTTMQ